MKKKFLTLLPLLFLLFVGIHSVNAQASYVSNSEAVTILQTEISDLSNVLQTATPGSNEQILAAATLTYYKEVAEMISSGVTIENALLDGMDQGTHVKQAVTLVEAMAQSPIVNAKDLYSQAQTLLQI